MNSTPSSHKSDPRSSIKSASRLVRLSCESDEIIPQFSVNLASPSPRKSSKFSTTLPLHELLLLSPSPVRKSKTRPADRIETASEEPIEHIGARRRCKSRSNLMGLSGCGSPRNNRRSRRRLELDERERERELGFGEENLKARKRRHAGKSRKEKLSLVVANPSPMVSPKSIDGNGCHLDGIGELIADLVMWNDIAKSSLWFGLGCLFFLSSCFAGGVSFSVFAMISQLGLLFLCISFFSNSLSPRDNDEKRREFVLTNDDILRVGRLVLPAANLAISKTRELFSGEPSMTLKVAPLLLLGAEYGYHITLWRLFSCGFFIGFTGPRLYRTYSEQINKRVASMKWRVFETWGACSHKKIVAASAITAFWNLSSVKMRLFTAFIFLVVLRYYRQHLAEATQEERLEEEDKLEQKKEEKALVVVAGVESHK